ncbi:hypothetical protein F5Y16DRAFT_368099 [Xylariaceae sp. FL0255]|nr:hypothetical protein F5Y16DRAFT_368099 [Xylariaceae sp. FL0255]
MPPPVSRRAHNKSRGGCSLCKARKIKCDENQPCGYCVKKGVPCSLGDKPKNPPERPGINFQDDLAFRFSDFALYRNFITQLAVDHADDAASITAWRDCVGQLATQYDYVLHQILCLSALHLRGAHPDQAQQLEEVAVEHQHKALPLFRDAINRQSKDETLALFACSTLIIPCTLAAANDPLSLIVNEAGGPPDWLALLDGAVRITREVMHTLIESPLRPILGIFRQYDVLGIDDSPADRAIVGLIDVLPYPDGRRDDYVRLMDLLRHFFTLSNRGPTKFDQKSAALRFPSFFSQTAKHDLASKEPAALVLLAFWFVLLYRIEDRWWLKDRVHPVVQMIHELLAPEHRHLVKWPMEQCGLSNST